MTKIKEIEQETRQIWDGIKRARSKSNYEKEKELYEEYMEKLAEGKRLAKKKGLGNKYEDFKKDLEKTEKEYQKQVVEKLREVS